MTHQIAANLVAPSIFQRMSSALVAPPKKTLADASATSSATSLATGAGSGTGATDTSGIGTTFLNLLIKELQNQDPTAPIDSTAMVGQMISLNQLDQLISIDQKVTQPATSTTGATSGATTGATSGASANPATLALPASSLSAGVSASSGLAGSRGLSGGTSTIARMTGTEPSMSNFVDLFPFAPGGGPTAPIEPIFGGINPPLSLDNLGFGSTANSISGGR